MPTNYMSVEDLLRQRQMQQIIEQQQQPYAEDLGNIEDIDTMLAARYGGADYAELLRTGAQRQMGAATHQYHAGYDALKGNIGEEAGPSIPRFAHAQPGALQWGAKEAGIGAGLADMLIRKGLGKLPGAGAGHDPGYQMTPLQDYGTSKIYAGYGPQGGPAGMDPTGRYAPTGEGVNTEAWFGGSDFQAEDAFRGGAVGGLESNLVPSADLSAHEAYRLGQIQAGTTGKEAGAAGAGGGMAQAGAGMAAGMLTSYLLNKYTNSPAGLTAAASGASGGAAAGAAGAAAGIAGGAITGGALGVAGYVASKLIAKEVFGVGKQSGRDVASGQFYESYQGKKMGKAAQAMGFEGSKGEAKRAALAQPYKWMTQEAKDYRAALAAGQDPTLTGKDHAAMMAPEYRPSQWEAWVGGMLDAGVSSTNIMDATSYYMSGKGHDRASDATDAFKKGQDFYMNPARGGTEEERAAKWAQVEQQYNKKHVPWMSQDFKDIYMKEYGHMKEAPQTYREKYGKKAEKKFAKDFGKKSWYERHGKMDLYQQRYNKYMLGEGMNRRDSFAGAYGPQGLEGAKSMDVAERTGIKSTMRWHDQRDIWGTGFKTYGEGGNTRMVQQVTGNTGGQGGHDVYGWVEVPADELEEQG